jgi:Protein of unknown function (DUF3306)
MSEHEDFLSRWSRLKRESEPTVDTVPGTDTAPAPVFDVATLPPIESIVADSDIRPFLALGVPAELTRAALRSAWAADPAIRDFVGIAESQWDFNDPAAIPGFGPLGVAEYARALETRALASLNSAVEGMQESPEEAARPTPASVDPQGSAPADEVRQVAAAPADSPSKNASEARPGSPARHPHGGALPQ